ncbi:beta-N-acetylhexosaminidase [Streptomyces gobiensis]|uniref:beta-N-acetylhexosaminidase n=1 Tax=Streptomyces gobiensis TaxID=2875706 RepID=UPI001E443274|nr:glycoside hydrolase family 20 protein [Streptomyces gobiensis]UGY93254.1 family 20 glycosylhydrolase [Streptomyces gobiensis]
MERTRRMSRVSRKKVALGVTALTATAVAGALTVTQLSGDGPARDTDRTAPPDDGRPRATAPSAPATPDSPRVAPAPEPRTIPAIRDWTPGRGPGWEPAKGSRVVADPKGPLTDEARLLARELKVRYSPGPARAGDVELALRTAAPGGREAYELVTEDERVTITGGAEAGVFYGTRTLLQSVRDRGRISEGVIRDRPDRPQRGMTLDIARKHFSAEWIEARIREMADLKLNQLQLHLSDDQAFRIESDSHPEVVSDPHLTKAEIRRIVKLAASLHIAVIPEIDSPGHLGAVLAAHPDLQLRDVNGKPVRGAIDIAQPKAARIIDDLLNEYAPLFPGTYWHLGGDEYAALFARNPEAAHPGLHRAAQRKYGDRATVQDLATGWLNDRAAVVRGHGKTPQVWNDGMHRGGVVTPHRDREVTYWTGKEIGAREPEEYLREGWNIVNLNDEYLYYVLGEPHDFTYPTGRRIYEEWTPAVLRGTKPVPESMAGPDRIVGGRFAIWCDLAGAQTTEQVAEGIRLPLRAVSQKLWDPREPKRSWADFKKLADRVE